MKKYPILIILALLTLLLLMSFSGSEEKGNQQGGGVIISSSGAGDGNDVNLSDNKGAFIINGNEIEMFLYHKSLRYNLSSDSPSEGGLPPGLKGQLNFDTKLIEEEPGRFRYNHTFSKAVSKFISKVGYVFPMECKFENPILDCDSFGFNFTEAIENQGLVINYNNSELTFEGDDLSYIDPIIDSGYGTSVPLYSGSTSIVKNSTGSLFVLYEIGNAFVGISDDSGTTWRSSDTGSPGSFDNQGDEGMLLINSSNSLFFFFGNNKASSSLLKVYISDDSGTTWSSGIIIDSIGASQDFEALSGIVDSQDNIVLCIGDNNANINVYNSTDGGLTWTKTLDIFSVDSIDDTCAIAVNSTDAYFLLGHDSLQDEIRFTSTTDPTSWATPTLVVADHNAKPIKEGIDAIVDKDDNILMISQQMGDDNNITFLNSSDNGDSWGQTNITVTAISDTDRYEIMSDKIGNIHVIMQEDATVNFANITYMNSTDGGLTWSAVFTLVEGTSDDMLYPHMIGTKFPSFNRVDGLIEYIYVDDAGNDVIYNTLDTQSTITINSNGTVPTTPAWNDVTQIWANLTFANNPIEVNFSVVTPNGSIIINNQNASWGGGNSGYWNSSTFTISDRGIYSDIGTWEWNYIAYDDSSNTQAESGNFTITNQDPTNGAVADPASINEDSGLNNNIITNNTLNETWSDTEEPTYFNQSWITSQTNSGVVNCVVDSDNNIDCTTQANQSGTNTITMHLMDSLGANTSSQTINIVVDAVNDPPLIGPVITNNNTDEDNTFLWNLSHYVSDIDSSVPGEINFTVIIDDSTLATLTPSNETLILNVTPIANVSGTMNFNFTFFDEEGSVLTSNATQNEVVFTINEINDAPYYNFSLPDVAVLENSGANGDVLTKADFDQNWSDVEDNLPSSYHISVETNTAIVDCAFDGGNNLDCTEAGISGFSDVTLNITDAGGLNATETIRVTVTDVNDAPVISDVDDFSLNEDFGTSAIDLTNNETDEESSGVGLNWTVTSNDTTRLTVSTVDIEADTFNFVSVANATGLINITLNLTDGDLNDTSSFILTLNAINDAPWSEAIANPGAINEDSGLNDNIVAVATINTAFRDVEDDQSLTSCTVQSESDTTAVDCAVDGSFNVDCTTQANQSGTNTVTLNCCDSGSSCTNMDTFTVTVNAVNDVPWWDSVSNNNTDEDTAFEWNLSHWMNDVEDTLLQLNVSYIVNDSSLATLSMDNDTNVLTITPNLNSFGDFAVNFTLIDTSDATASQDWINFTINSVNDNPIINSNVTIPSTPEWLNSTLIMANVTDVDNDLINVNFTLIAPNGTTVINNTNATIGANGDFWNSSAYSVDDYGTWTWTVNATDSSSATVGGIGSFTITNQNPVISRVFDFSQDEDFGNYTLDLTANETDLEDSGAGLNWTLSLNQSGIVKLRISNLAADMFNFTSIANISGSVNVSLELNDSQDATDTSSFILTINAVNDPPAEPILFSPGNNTLNGDSTPTLRWQNASDVDGDALTYGLTLDDNADFSSPIRNDSGIAESGISCGSDTCSQFVIPSALSDGTYYWRVNTSDGTVESAFSLVWQFDVDATFPSISEEITTPSDTSIIFINESVYVNATITDSTLDSATIRMESNFNGSWFNYSSSEGVSNVSDNFTFFMHNSNWSNQQAISWRYRATDEDNKETVGTMQSFTIQNRVATCTLNSPSSGTTQTSTTVTLSAIPGDPDDDNVNVTFIGNSFKSNTDVINVSTNQANGSTISFDWEDRVDGTQYFWSAKCGDGIQDSDQTSERNFTISIPSGDGDGGGGGGFPIPILSLLGESCQENTDCQSQLCVEGFCAQVAVCGNGVCERDQGESTRTCFTDCRVLTADAFKAGEFTFYLLIGLLIAVVAYIILVRREPKIKKKRKKVK